MDLVSKDQLDFFLEFRNMYQQILEDFNFDYKDDIKSKDILSAMMEERKDKFKLLEILKSFNRLLKNTEAPSAAKFITLEKKLSPKTFLSFITVFSRLGPHP